MMIRQPISRPWRIGLGIASIVSLLFAYTLLSQSRLATAQREQQDVAREKLLELDDQREKFQQQFREAEAVEDAAQRERRQSLLKTQQDALDREIDEWQQLAESPDARDLTIPTWHSLWREGFVRATSPQGSFQRKEVWLFNDFKVTLLRLFTALGIGVLVSVLLGLLMGCTDPAEAFFMPPFAFLSKVPATAVLPIFFALVGVNFRMYVIIIVFGMLPTLAQSICQSVRKDVPEELIFKAYTLGASQIELVWNVIYRQVLPRILDAARLQIGPALVLLVAAEWMVAGEGIGYRLRLFYQRTDMTVVFVYVALLGAFGLAFDYLLIWTRRWLCPWFGE
jgi:ABC-type nitrate/sulfonate/bicarbonate transport system permease component